MRESVPGSLMLCGWRRGGTVTESVTETDEHPAARPTPGQVRTLLAPLVCVIDLRPVLVSYQHINLSPVHSFQPYRLVRFLFKI